MDVYIAMLALRLLETLPIFVVHRAAVFLYAADFRWSLQVSLVVWLLKEAIPTFHCRVRSFFLKPKGIRDRA